MVNLTSATKSVKADEIKRYWHLIDAKDQIVGRLSTTIAGLLIGKSKVNFVPYLDMGDHVVVINALHVRLTGSKSEQKVYSRYSGYPGGLKEVSFEQMKEKKPTEIIRHAVMGMLPKNKLRARRIARLEIFKDNKHPYKEKFTDKLLK